MRFSRKPVALRLSNYLAPSQRFLVARTQVSAKHGANAHRHDFAEFFWITAGTCRHRYDGGSEILDAGDIRFVRPEHTHEFASVGGLGAQLTNIALGADFIPLWGKTYPALGGHFFWNANRRPSGQRLGMEHIARLEEAADALARETSNLLRLHYVMMRLFIELLSGHDRTPLTLPAWLKRGVGKLAEISVFGNGVPGFVKACGRCPEHVSRATRKHLGVTPGSLVNEARMNYAARQLRMTDDNILNIMIDCGLNNPSHFYALFRARYGATPRQYRLHRQRIVGFIDD